MMSRSTTAARGRFRPQELLSGRGAGGPPSRRAARARRWPSRRASSTAVYWLLLAVGLAGLVYVVFARVGDYAHGPAVVRVDGRLDLDHRRRRHRRWRSTSKPGDRGDRRHRRWCASTRAPSERELAQLEREFELKLVRILLHPDDEVTRQSLAALRAARELAAAPAARAPGDRAAGRRGAQPAHPAGAAAGPRRRGADPGRREPGRLLGGGAGAGAVPPDAEAGHAPALRRWTAIPQVGAAPAGGGGRRRGGGAAARCAATWGRSWATPCAGRRARWCWCAPGCPSAASSFEGERYRYYDGIPGRVDVRVRSACACSTLLFPALKELARGR